MDVEYDFQGETSGFGFSTELHPLNPEAILNEEQVSTEFKVKLYEGRQKLMIFDKTVVWMAGTLLIRQINLENPIIDCFFTVFSQESSHNSDFINDTPDHKVLVVVLEDQIRVYDKLKPLSIVSFPIHIQNAFPFYRGIVIGKKHDSTASSNFHTNKNTFPIDPNKFTQESPYSAQSPTPFLSHNNFLNSSSSSSSSIAYSEGNFLTLTDPVGELGLIVSSSTSSFSSKELIVLYPEYTSSTLAATYNSLDKTITIYHTRYLSRSKRSKSKSVLGLNSSTRKNSKRSISGGNMMLSSTSRFLDDDPRNSRFTSNPLSYDRMASGTEYLSDTVGTMSSSVDNWTLRKEAIFTKLISIPFNSDVSYLKVFNISYNDKEAIVIVNLEFHLITIYLIEKSSSQAVPSKFKDTITIDGLDAAKFDMGTTNSTYIAFLHSNREIVLYNPFYGLFSPSIQIPTSYPPVVSIDDISDLEISLLCEDGKHYTIYLQTKVVGKHINILIESLKYLSHDLIYENFWLQWCANMSLNIPNCDEWKLYVITLLSVSLPDNLDLSQTDFNTNEITKLLPYVEKARLLNKKPESMTFTNNADLSLEPLLPKIVLALHLVREDLRLNILAQEQFNKLSVLLSQLIYWMSWSRAWHLYYKIDNQKIDKSLNFPLAEYISKPPNIMESLSSLFSNKLVSYITFSIIAGEDETVDSLITPRTYNILRLFEVIISSEFENLDLIRTMVSSGVNASEMETYPPGIFFIFKNTIELCQKKIKSNWNVSRDELKLIGRNDLLQLNSSNGRFTFNTLTSELLPKPMNEILAQLSSNEVLGAWDDHAEADKFHVTRLIFSQDRRFYELTKLLQTSKVQTVTYEADPNLDDHEKLLHQRSICATVALRTLTTPIGRGAVFNCSRKPLITEGFPIPKMNFNTLILPDNINVTLETDVIPEYLFAWGYFHNGASAGLSVSKEFNEISGSWVVFNRPPVLNAQHAGFLLGLGLNGHLKQLEEWHIYNYLGPKHIHTSIGLLIGMAASFKGTMDIKMTKVLSVHVVAFLPTGSTNLNVQLPVQTAGLIGIGLVYLESQHRRMSEVLLAQISSVLIINDKRVVSEGYQLAAGIALGYINLGKGEKMQSAHDTHIIDSLIAYGTSVRDVQTLKQLDKSCSGAVMSLMFMFLKTNNIDIAEKLSLPKTIQLLEYIRPDLLMLRCLAKNMVLWNKIQPTKDFVEEQIPQCVARKYSLELIDTLNTNILPYINILTGALLSISICYASTGNVNAKITLLYYFDILFSLGSLDHQNYDTKVALIGVRNSRDVVILGLSIIMAGTGDLDVMRRLRYLQGINDEYTKYGNYMAINMSLGFLFLGGGQQAFNTNNNFAIASLITSVYPMFGSNNYETLGDADGRGNSEINDLHLQALRHFWALSVENRCLIVREVCNEKAVKVDVDVLLKNDVSLKVSSPCLLPDLSLIHKISVSPNNTYFPVEFDLLRSDTKANDIFKKKLNLYVDKKAIYKNLKLDFIERVNMDQRLDYTNFKRANTSGINCLKELNIFNDLKPFEKDILFNSIQSGSDGHSINSTVFDFKYEIEQIVNNASILDDDKLMNLKLIFNFVDSIILLNEDKELVRRAKKRKRKFLGVGDNNLDDYFNLEENEDNLDDANLSGGLNYLNIEFMEKLKKDLFSKIG